MVGGQSAQIVTIFPNALASIHLFAMNLILFKFKFMSIRCSKIVWNCLYSRFDALFAWIVSSVVVDIVDIQSSSLLFLLLLLLALAWFVHRYDV